MSAAPSRPSVRVAPTGVRAWLVQPRRSAERDLVEHLLAPGARHAPDLRSLAQTAGRPLTELARALFQLHRHECLLVAQGPPSGDCEAPVGLAGLSADLEALLDGRGEAVIADRDGLCLAVCGWRGRQADDAAALVATRSIPASARWWFSSGEVTLAATKELDPESPAWVCIARRLLHACGPLAAGAAT